MPQKRLEKLGVNYHYNAISRGVIDTRDLLYFISVILLFIFASTISKTGWILIKTQSIILMTLTMFLSFTGYLLPWDQLAIWAITVGTNMARAHPFIGSEGPGASLLTIGDLNLVTSSSDVRFALLGGRFVGEATLLRFYVLHCILVPFIAMIFMAVHFWRIRKDGGISGPL